MLLHRRRNRYGPVTVWALVTLGAGAGLLVGQSAPGPSRVEGPPAGQLQDAIQLMETKGDCPAAIRLLENVAGSADRALAARSLLYIGLCQEKLGKAEARSAYQRVVDRFADQRDAVAQARARLSALGFRPGASGAMTVRRVWAASDVFNTSLSSDARLASFPDWNTASVAVHDFKTNQTRRLTSKSSLFESDEYPEATLISPDDRQVAYTWSNQQGLYELRVIGIDGGTPRVVLRNEEVPYLRPAGWSPDGKSILAVLFGKSGANQVALVSMLDGSVRVLKTFDWRSPNKMAFSPDGRYIVYDSPQREDSASSNLYVLAADGSREAPLVTHAADDAVLGWSPDGRTILFSSDRTGLPAAWMIRVVDGKPVGSPELVRSDMGRGHGIRFTRDGSFYYGVRVKHDDIYVATLDTATGELSPPQVPTGQRFVGSNNYPEWSPDGRALAYISQNRPGGRGVSMLCILRLDDGEIREIVPKLNYFGRMRWSPDGRSILVHGRDARNRGGLFIVDIQSGAVTPAVMSGPNDGGYPREAAWMPDGKAIVYKHVNSPILLRDLASGQDRIVYEGSSVFALSPDGRWLVVTEGDPSTKNPNNQVLKLVRIGQGVVRELARSSRGIGSFKWSPDGRHMLYIKAPPDAPRTELWRVSVDNGASQRLGVVPDGATQLAAHPDGRRVAFAASSSFGDLSATDELWVMENFLPAQGNATGARRPQ